MFVCLSGHINNLYNTVFWTLVQKGGLTTAQAEDRLKVRAENNFELINTCLFLQAQMNVFTQLYRMLQYCLRGVPLLFGNNLILYFS